MPLPKISTPTYELEIPSTGKKIKYRPFLVKEEKVLIIAMESENLKEIAPHASPNKIMTKYYDEILELNNRLFSSLSYFDPEPIEESRVVELKF